VFSFEIQAIFISSTASKTLLPLKGAPAAWAEPSNLKFCKKPERAASFKKLYVPVELKIQASTFLKNTHLN
jgi:hypothetical protein